MALFPKREEMEGIECEEILRFDAMIARKLRKCIGYEMHRIKCRLTTAAKFATVKLELITNRMNKGRG